GRPDARTVDDNTTIGPPVSDALGHSPGDDRVIDCVAAERAAVLDRVAALREPASQLLFQLESAVICSDGDPKGRGVDGHSEPGPITDSPTKAKLPFNPRWRQCQAAARDPDDRTKACRSIRPVPKTHYRPATLPRRARPYACSRMNECMKRSARRCA